MFGAIAGGIASALAGGAMSKLFGGGQKAASGGIQGDVLATDNNTVGMGDAMKSRRGFAIQRLMNAMRQAHADGWFIVFDTLTLADDRLEAFYDNPNALRDYFRDIGRMVLAAGGRKANDSHADCYQYFCVPEYGTANGRLHFHAVHFMRTLPTGSVDPNFGRRVRNRRQLNSLQNTWPYGYSMPIAVRYTQDAFSRSGWLWPVDAKGEPLKATSYMAVGFYVAKYVNKKSDMDLAAKGLGAK